MIDFQATLKKLLMSEEYNKTEEQANLLIKTYPMVVANGIVSRNLNATAMALEMADEK